MIIPKTLLHKVSTHEDKTMLNPSSPIAKMVIPQAQGYFTNIAEDGTIQRYCVQNNLPVLIEEVSSIKHFYQTAIERASVMTQEQTDQLEEREMTHIELAALRLAENAAAGSLHATQELFDRVLGKPKMFTETTNLNVSIDDILNQIDIAQDPEPLTPSHTIEGSTIEGSTIAEGGLVIDDDKTTDQEDDTIEFE